MSILELFCAVDDFCQAQYSLVQQLLLPDNHRRRRTSRLCLSEVMTIAIHFHQADYRTFKHYYQEHVCLHLRAEFPGLVSYSRFVELLVRAAPMLVAYLNSSLGECTGLSFVDSTPLAVCKPTHCNQHKVFAGLARRGKTSVGWFYGFKLHLTINHQGELLSCQLTPGDCDDRTPVPVLAQRLHGMLYADKGYIDRKLVARLLQEQGVHLVTYARQNMRGRLVLATDALWLRKRNLIESVIEQLKHVCQIEHSRHRSVANFVVNLFAGLVAYCLRPNKPSLVLPAAGYLPAP
jgi:hypothetical protein